MRERAHGVHVGAHRHRLEGRHESHQGARRPLPKYSEFIPGFGEAASIWKTPGCASLLQHKSVEKICLEQADYCADSRKLMVLLVAFLLRFAFHAWDYKIPRNEAHGIVWHAQWAVRDASGQGVSCETVPVDGRRMLTAPGKTASSAIALSSILP